MERLTEVAEAIAVIAHAGQTRMDGVEPYVNHPLRVAKALTERPGGTTYGVYAAAVLHDVLEDTAVTAEHLRTLGISEYAIGLVEIVTRTEGETYWEYLDRVVASGSGDAVALKVADIRDNLVSLPEGHGLVRRYEKALKILGA